MTITRPRPSQGTQRVVPDALLIDACAGDIVAPEPPLIDGKNQLERLLAGGVNCVNVTLAGFTDGFEEFLRKMYMYLNLIDAKPEQVLQVRTVADIAQAQREGKLGVIFGTQTGSVVGHSMHLWTIFHQLGLRMAQLTYNERNLLGDGCMEPENRGLTSFGRQSIQEMNRLGITLDLSHVGERTALDATAYSTKPVIYSHAHPKKLNGSPRNITDEQIKAMAATGGVMGISAYSELAWLERGRRPTVKDLIRVVDYVVEMVGIDRVGIGSDMFESETKLNWETTTKRLYPNQWTFETLFVDGFSTASDFSSLIEALARRGYSDEDVRKIAGLNWLRVFDATWR